MYHLSTNYLRIGLGLVFAFVCFAPLKGQVSNPKSEDAWKTILYAKDVDYGAFSCDTSDKKAVIAYFKTNPLKSFLPICHNNCPIISCRPVIYFPPAAKAIRVTGSVKVHVLVDEKGRVLYARALTGHPLLLAAAVQGACKTGFKEYPYGKHQGIMEFTVDNYDYLTVPFTANQVWE